MPLPDMLPTVADLHNGLHSPITQHRKVPVLTILIRRQAHLVPRPDTHQSPFPSPPPFRPPLFPPVHMRIISVILTPDVLTPRPKRLLHHQPHILRLRRRPHKRLQWPMSRSCWLNGATVVRGLGRKHVSEQVCEVRSGIGHFRARPIDQRAVQVQHEELRLMGRMLR